MKLHDFTSEYTVTLCQSPSDGTYWAAVYREGNKEPELETDNYEDYEDAMAKAMFYIDQQGNEERDEALTDRYCGADEKPDRWRHPDE